MRQRYGIFFKINSSYSLCRWDKSVISKISLWSLILKEGLWWWRSWSSVCMWKKTFRGKLNGLYWNSIPNVDVQKSVLFISPFAKLRLFRNYICCYYFFFLVSLADIDECSASKPVCATNATGCQNTVGSFSCSCEAGFGGRYCNG